MTLISNDFLQLQRGEPSTMRLCLRKSEGHFVRRGRLGK
jgi:hypothetical protein